MRAWRGVIHLVGKLVCHKLSGCQRLAGSASLFGEAPVKSVPCKIAENCHESKALWVEVLLVLVLRTPSCVSFPDGILWRANGDGSSPLQLTNSTIYPRLPSWSPDGTRLVFMTSPPPSGNTRAYIVSSQGGTPRLLLPGEAGPKTEPNWSADGRKIVFSTSKEAGDDPKSVIRFLELDGNHISTLRGSVGMFSPRWSPDGHAIVTLAPQSRGRSTFDIRPQRWSTPYKGLVGFPTWSIRVARYSHYLACFFSCQMSYTGDMSGILSLAQATGRDSSTS